MSTGDFVVWFLIWLFGTFGAAIGVWFFPSVPPQIKGVLSAFVISASLCGGITLFTALSWKENWPWFFICGGSLAIFVSVVVFFAWRSYQRNGRRVEQIEQH